MNAKKTMLDKHREPLIKRILEESKESEWVKEMRKVAGMSFQKHVKPRSNDAVYDPGDDVSRRVKIKNVRLINKWLRGQGVDFKIPLTDDEKQYYHDVGNKNVNLAQTEIKITDKVIQTIRSFKNRQVPGLTNQTRRLYLNLDDNDNEKKHNPFDSERNELLDLISSVFIYLQVTSGRRISEQVWDGMKLEGNLISFKPSKTGLENSTFKPLIPARKWFEQYVKIQPYLELGYSVNTINKRILRYLRKILPKDESLKGSHTLRKIYGKFCSMRHPELTEEKALADCLNHNSLESAMYYRGVKLPENSVADNFTDIGNNSFRCKVCGSTIKRAGRSRHMTSKKHKKALESRFQL